MHDVLKSGWKEIFLAQIEAETSLACLDFLYYAIDAPIYDLIYPPDIALLLHTDTLKKTLGL